MGIGIALLISSACGYGLEVLNTTDEEWVAPGYEIIEEAVIDPLEYGEPYLSDWRQQFGCRLGFTMASDSTEHWFATLVLADRVIRLEENCDPVTTTFDFPVDDCALSPDGRFVVIHAGGRNPVRMNSLWMDAMTGETVEFDPQPGGEWGPPWLFVGDDGSVATISDHKLRLFDADLELVSEYQFEYANFKMYADDGSRFACDEIGVDGHRIIVFGRSGDIEWTYEYAPSGSAVRTNSEPFMSCRSELIALPLTDGLRIIDGSTGVLECTLQPGYLIALPVISPGLSRIVFGRTGGGLNTLFVYRLDDGEYLPDYSISPSGHLIMPVAVSDPGAAIVISIDGNGPRGKGRLVFIERTGEVCFVSALGPSVDAAEIAPNGWDNASLSHDGSRLAYYDLADGEIVVARLAADPMPIN